MSVNNSFPVAKPPPVADDSHLYSVEDAGHPIELAAKFQSVSYHPLFGDVNLRHIYIIGSEQIGKEFVRMLNIVLPHPHLAVKAGYRDDLEDRTEQGCGIPGQIAVQAVCGNEELRREIVRYRSRQRIAGRHFLSVGTDT